MRLTVMWCSFENHEATNAQLYSLGYKDKSWSVNMLARVARKHGLPQLCNEIINKMYGYPTMEVSEAFTKIQEQCRAFVEAPNQEVSFSLFSPYIGQLTSKIM